MTWLRKNAGWMLAMAVLIGMLFGAVLAYGGLPKQVAENTANIKKLESIVTKLANTLPQAVADQEERLRTFEKFTAESLADRRAMKTSLDDIKASLRILIELHTKP
jgi:hypothetical protein